MTDIKTISRRTLVKSGLGALAAPAVLRVLPAHAQSNVIKAAFGRRLAVLGPLENADMVGTDLTLAIHKTVLPDIDSRPGPSPYLEKLVRDGKFGFKSGEGFRKWSPQQQAELRSKVMQHLKAARARDA